MGSIYNQKDSSFWWIAYTDHQGRRRWESSRSARKGDAQRLLRQREGRAAEGKDPGAQYAKVTLSELAEGIDVPSESFVVRQAVRRWYEALHKKKRR